jgi:hypothetical protein
MIKYVFSLDQGLESLLYPTEANAGYPSILIQDHAAERREQLVRESVYTDAYEGRPDSGAPQFMGLE